MSNGGWSDHVILTNWQSEKSCSLFSPWKFVNWHYWLTSMLRLVVCLSLIQYALSPRNMPPTTSHHYWLETRVAKDKLNVPFPCVSDPDLAWYFFSYIKMHFSYVSRISYVGGWICYVIMFTPEHSLLQWSIPLQSPGPPPDPARQLTLPATWPGPPPDPALHPPCQLSHPARHPTSPATTPCLRPHSFCPFSQGYDGVTIVATRWCCPRHSAKAVCVGWRSINNLHTLSNNLDR